MHIKKVPIDKPTGILIFLVFLNLLEYHIFDFSFISYWTCFFPYKKIRKIIQWQDQNLEKIKWKWRDPPLEYIQQMKRGEFAEE